MPHLDIRLLGPPRIELDGQPVTLPRAKATALLALLAVADAPQRRDTLATMLWPEQSQSQARAGLREEGFAGYATGPGPRFGEWRQRPRRTPAPFIEGDAQEVEWVLEVRGHQSSSSAIGGAASRPRTVVFAFCLGLPPWFA